MDGATTANVIRRKVDDLGRVVIPAAIRRSLNIREGDALEVAVEGERVVLARPQDACVFCAREDQALVRFRNRLLCAGCVAALRDLVSPSGPGEHDPVAAVPPSPIPEPPPSPTPGPVPDPQPSPIPPDPLPPTPGPDPSPPGPGPDPAPDPDPSPQPPPEPDPEPAPAGTDGRRRPRHDQIPASTTAW